MQLWIKNILFFAQYFLTNNFWFIDATCNSSGGGREKRRAIFIVKCISSTILNDWNCYETYLYSREAYFSLNYYHPMDRGIAQVMGT